MSDNMSANIVIKSLLSGVVNNVSKLSGVTDSTPLLSAIISHGSLLNGSVINVNYLAGKASINLAQYDDPVDYLMFQNGVRMRTESDIYIKTEASA